MYAMWHTQRGVFHLPRLLAEDRAQQALFRAQLGFAPGRDFPDQNIVRANFSTDADDTVLIEIGEALLADVRDVPRYLLRPQLGVSGFGFIFLDVNRGVDVVPNQPLADQDGILEVPALPGHERDD